MLHPSLPRAPGEVRFGLEGDDTVLYLTGEIDTATVAAFEAAVPAANGSLVEVMVVDASAVTFMNSVGARLLLQLTQPARKAGLRPCLRRPSRSALQVLTMTGLEQLFDRLD
ncbi:STAS domain-containing protein [Geodermatophilus sp. SYSU D00965]